MIQGAVEKHRAGSGYDERLRIGWDFSDHHTIRSGLTLSGTPTVAVDTAEGSQDGGLTVESPAAISGNQVLAWVTGGTIGQTYVLKCSVTLSSGGILVEALALKVVRY